MRFSPRHRRLQRRAFTIIEMLVATAVLSVLVLLISQFFNSASTITTLNRKRLEADAQARGILDRMAIDFGRALRRPDVDYYLKASNEPMPGNDQMAFYAETRGYYPASGVDRQSPFSLVSFRVNDVTNSLERMGKGLLWNGVDTAGNSAMVYRPLTIENTWPAATNQAVDANYEPFGPEVFRFEYGYILNGVTTADGTVHPSIFSKVPWDSRSGINHTHVDGLRDVAAIVIFIAVIDPRSRSLVSESDLGSLSADMADFEPSGSSTPADLEAQWRSTIESSTLPKPVKDAIFTYRRTFPITPSLQ